MEAELVKLAADYGSLGLMVAYLMYDRQIIMAKLTRTMEANTGVLRELCLRIQMAPCGKEAASSEKKG